MKFILDVNVILSALIKDSITRKIIKESNLEFYFPELSFKKIIKYSKYIMKKTGLNREELNYLIIKLLSHIKIMEIEKIKKNWKKAKEIMGKIDEEDIIFIATSLSIPNSVIWSDDKHFNRQKEIKVIKTKEMIKYTGINS